MSGRIKYWLLPYFFLFSVSKLFAQAQLTLTQPQSGIKLIVANKNFPLLKILLPGQSATDRGIEVEFPEHVTGLNEKTNRIEHLYLVTRGNSNRRTVPEWKIEGNAIVYKTTLNESIKMTARVAMDSIGVSFTYTFINNSTISYKNFQAVTCVKLYADFSDSLLERTYVHHSNGFDLLASETPQRLTMGLTAVVTLSLPGFL